MILGTAKRVREGDKPEPTRTFSDKQEKSVVKATGGKQVANSGATDFGGKADVIIDNLVSIECKTKTKKSDSMSIQRCWLEKLKQDAMFDCTRFPVLAFNLGPGEPNYYIINEDMFIDLIEYLRTRGKF